MIEQDPIFPSRARAWTFIGVLFVASIVSVIDRSLLSIVVDSVKTDIGVSDVHISLLQGLAFGLFYAAVGVPLGLAADRYSRRWLVVGGMTLWCAATICGGLAQSFNQMFLSRILVGLGEAALSPAAISLIGDLFPPHKRGRPISIFLMGQSVANGLSFMVAGALLGAAKAGHFKAVPLIGGLAAWRTMFICCGLAGLLVAAMMLILREPRRRGARQFENFAAQAGESCAFLARNIGIFAPFYLGFSLYFLGVYGAGAWTPAMLMRGFGATHAQLGQWLGPLSLAFGILGPLLGGFLVDRQARRGSPIGGLKLLMIAPFFALPSVFAVFMPGLGAAIFFVAAMGAVSVLIGTATLAALQSMVPANMRGVSIALTGLVNTVIGATTGPLLVALATERLYRNPAMVGYSITTVAAPALLLGAGFYGLAFLGLRRQLRTGGEVADLFAQDAVQTR